MSELAKAQLPNQTHAAPATPTAPHDAELPGFWDHYAQHQANGSDPGTRSTPADPIHAQLWAHELGLDVQQPVPYQGVRAGTGLTKDAMGADAIEEVGDLAFSTGDFVLSHGGQVALDIASFVPVVNKYTEGAQAGYHALHAAYDCYEGNNKGATEEVGEALWHGTMMGVNKLVHVHPTGEATAHAIAGAAQAEEGFNGIHAAHSLVDAAELTWDSGATLVQQMSGSHEKLPFLGGVAPWALGGAGKGGDE